MRDHPAGGHQLHRGRARGALAEWRFRVGFTPREGLVLYLVRYQDHGTLRPVIYRASLAEMVIPYGDPNPTHYRKNVFDMGEYGIGVLANSLELGCDCLGEIHYFDACINDNDGHAAGDQERDLPARGRSRHLVEARRLADRQDGGPAARGGW